MGRTAALLTLPVLAVVLAAGATALTPATADEQVVMSSFGFTGAPEQYVVPDNACLVNIRAAAMDTRLRGLSGPEFSPGADYHCRDIRRACERLCVPAGRSEAGNGRPILWRRRNSEPEHE